MGNVGKINADIGKITFETLEKFNIPYDEIYFGKPYADFYIDDLAINCFDDLEKELGYYNNKIEPRDFHTIQTGSFETIIKKGDLKGGALFAIDFFINRIWILICQCKQGTRGEILKESVWIIFFIPALQGINVKKLSIQLPV